MSVRKVWIASYDIKNIRIINRVAKILLSCMVRIQESVFMGHLDDNMVYLVYEEVSALIDEDDLFLLCPVCRDDVKGIKVVGKSLLKTEDTYLIL